MGGGGHIFADDDTLLAVEWRQRRLPRLTSAARRPSEEVKRPLGGPTFFFFCQLRNLQNIKERWKKSLYFYFSILFLLENRKYEIKPKNISGIICFDLLKMQQIHRVFFP